MEAEEGPIETGPAQTARNRKKEQDKQSKAVKTIGKRTYTVADNNSGCDTLVITLSKFSNSLTVEGFGFFHSSRCS